MKEETQIEHKGFVKSIEDEVIYVGIVSDSACGSCQVKGGCSLSEAGEKVIDIKVANPTEYFVGEEVEVFFRQSLGFRALFLAYVLPFFIVIIGLIFLFALTDNELISGLVSLSFLIPYYFILYNSRKKIKKTFSFHIRKIMF
jgi:sigma-E factor negative regulatory protein RseC